MGEGGPFDVVLVHERELGRRAGFQVVVQVREEVVAHVQVKLLLQAHHVVLPAPQVRCNTEEEKKKTSRR